MKENQNYEWYTLIYINTLSDITIKIKSEDAHRVHRFTAYPSIAINKPAAHRSRTHPNSHQEYFILKQNWNCEF